MNISFSVANSPACKDFFLIKREGEPFRSIDGFISDYPDISDSELESCEIQYRGETMLMLEYYEKLNRFSEEMDFVHFIPPIVISEENIRIASYFTKKAIECLQFARFFTLKSNTVIDSNSNISWKSGYVPQFYFRCIYFGTSTTWFSNAFDHVLQSVYWGLGLYTSAEDREGNSYCKSWKVQETLACCTYDFVIKELKNRGLSEMRSHLTKCSASIEKVRMWANYIKHKGGIDYQFLEAESPFRVFVAPSEIGADIHQVSRLDEEYELKQFLSPVSLDIDDEMQKLVDAHSAISQCIYSTISDIDYEQYRLL